MKINKPKVVTSEKRKVFCPYCIFNYQYIPMVYDFKSETWHCNNCNETMKKNDDVVHKGKLVAGNEKDFNKPYGRSVDFNKRIIPKTQDTYNNPMSAWTND